MPGERAWVMKGEVSFQCSMFPKEEQNCDTQLSLSKTHAHHRLVSSEQGKHLKKLPSILPLQWTYREADINED